MISCAGLSLDVSGCEAFLSPAQIDALSPRVSALAGQLAAGTGAGSDYLGWLDLPVAANEAQIVAIEAAAAQARQDSEAYVVIGIGGSYLGAQAVLTALGPAPDAPAMLFTGTGLDAVALGRVLARIRDCELRTCVISKSGTTLEPAVAFRLVRTAMIQRYGRVQAGRRIAAVTDASKGALRQLATQEGYETYVIPDDVGGRFSVLTPVGLLPLAVAGIDIRELLAGAAAMREACLSDDLRANPAHLYAACRYALYEKGYTTEVLSSFSNDLQQIQEWWKQLFGESEGKEGKGIFPASTVFTTDLHSLGQYLQDGRRSLLETFLILGESNSDLRVPPEPEVEVDDTPGDTPGEARGTDSTEAADLDGLNYLVGRSLDEINRKAYEGTRRAHIAGGVPCLSIEIERLSPATVGALLYMFEKAVAISGYLLGVNPFDQPGVEMYKREMFNLLGKP